MSILKLSCPHDAAAAAHPAVSNTSSPVRPAPRAAAPGELPAAQQRVTIAPGPLCAPASRSALQLLESLGKAYAPRTLPASLQMGRCAKREVAF